MRLSRGGLLVLVAFTAPLLVELRTVLGFFNIDVGITGIAIFGALLIGAIVFWATLPERERTEATA